MVKCINVVLREQKVQKRKGKVILCVILGAAFTAAQKERYTNKQVEGKKITGCLQDLEKRLQDQLNEKRESTVWDKTLFVAEREHTRRLQVEFWVADEIL